jgi:hypothetical protein
MHQMRTKQVLGAHNKKLIQTRIKSTSKTILKTKIWLVLIIYLINNQVPQI